MFFLINVKRLIDNRCFLSQTKYAEIQRNARRRGENRAVVLSRLHLDAYLSGLLRSYNDK